MRRAKPAAELTINSSTIRSLLQAQHADLAELPIVGVGEGWDNALFRVGDDLLVRVPRRAAAAPLIEHEQRWLPELSPRLSLPVPVPLRIGHPGAGMPWAWSIVRWFAGQSALAVPTFDAPAVGAALGGFLRALHRPAPPDAPRNPWRGIPLAARTPILQDHLQRLDGLVDRDAILAAWDGVLSAREWAGPAVWIHGDLHPGNLLIDDRRLSAVIDFGDLTAGDPATDLSVMWMLLPGSARPSFLAAARGDVYALDDDTLVRARGWALALGVAYLAHSLDDDAMAMLGRATIASVLGDGADGP